MIDYDKYKHANFKRKESDCYALVRCCACDRENYALNVLSGICTWCGWDINKKNAECFTDE